MRSISVYKNELLNPPAMLEEPLDNGILTMSLRNHVVIEPLLIKIFIEMVSNGAEMLIILYHFNARVLMLFDALST